jgi:hypothetical protein
LENLKGKGNLEDLGVDGRIILEMKWGGNFWTGCIWFRIMISRGLV